MKTQEPLDISGGLKAAASGWWNPRAWASALRHPVKNVRSVAGTGPIYALLILFGLNAVDELDRSAFGVLLPTIRDEFGLSDTGITSLVAVTAVAALLLQLPIAIWADQGSRTRLAIGGAAMWGVFSFLTGMASVVWFLVIVRSFAGIGRAVVDPTHNSLLSDYFEVGDRPRVFSFHRAGNAVGQFVGPLAAGLLAHYFDWRTPFFVFAIPTIILVIAALRLKEPIRGTFERKASGATAEVYEADEPRVSFSESWRTVWKVESLRRLWYAIPFLAISIVGFVSLAGLLYDRVYGYNELQRGVLAACVEPAQLIGLAIGARVGMVLFARDPALVFRFLRYVAFWCAAMAALFAWSPHIVVTIVANVLLSGSLAILLPGVFAALSMAIPARARAVGFAVGSYWAIPGLAFVPMIGWLSDNIGIRWGMALMAPLMAIGGVMISSVSVSIKRDIEDVWKTSAARSAAFARRNDKNAPLLLVSELEVSYGPMAVLTGVNLEVARGETIALLGTNGAGKSTLLNAISGFVEADYGAVVFNGIDTTHAPPHEIALRGIIQMPGGKGIFGDLTVEENLSAAAWRHRGSAEKAQSMIDTSLEAFPDLAARMSKPAGDLSGGQQQMLALAMSLIAAPELLMIDELSLGLAPLVVGKLAELVREVADGGTTIIVVEQSLNVALSITERAVFLERGVVQFSGPTSDLLERPDLIRSVFLGSATEESAQEQQDPKATPGSKTRAIDSGEQAILALRDVNVAFGGNVAVESVSLDVAPHEVVGLIGPNGAGKTTLLDAIGGFVSTSGGTIELLGADVSAMGANKRALLGIGRTFQDAALFSPMTVRETLAVAHDRWLGVKDPFSGAFRTPAAIEEDRALASLITETIARFGLEAYEHRFISELSTGTRRVVELAAASAHRPAVLLLDEPSSGLAQREAEAMVPLIQKIRDELSCSIVIVEHDMVLLSAIADRLVALELGRVIASGTPKAVLDDPWVQSSYLGNRDDLIKRSGSRADTQPNE